MNSQKLVNGLDNLVSQTRSMMNEKNITSYLILTKSYFSRAIVVNEDMNKSEEDFLINDFEAFIFWQENAKCFVKFIDKDFSYRQLEFNKCDFLRLDKNSISLILKEEVLPVAVIDDGKEVYLVEPIDRKTTFYFAHGNSREFPDFYFNGITKSNLNYNLNSKLQIWNLYQTCHKTIDENIEILRKKQ